MKLDSTSTQELAWVCILCNFKQVTYSSIFSAVDREGMFCVNCGSSWRDRCLVLQVLNLCGLPSTFLFEFKLDFSHKVLGIGDSFRVQAALASRLDYTNTFIDKFPTLNLEELPNEIINLNILTCSEVLEHVFDLNKCLINIKFLLGKNGKAVLSVPISSVEEIMEHYPDIKSYQVADNTVRWIDHNNIEHLETAPIFHGGDANTLEIRAIGETQFLHLIDNLGFEIFEGPIFNPELGVWDLGLNHGFYIIQNQKW